MMQVLLYRSVYQYKNVWMDGWMDGGRKGGTDRFSCFTEISSAESQIRKEPCAHKKSSDIEKNISLKKETVNIMWIRHKLFF